MAKLEDYGIRIINHGEWSDPEVEWKKSDFQTLLFNYWDVAEYGDLDSLDLTNENDIKELRQWLWELTPWGYSRPMIDYEWEVDGYDDCDYYKDEKLSWKDDFVLHNSSQALRQALKYIDDNGIMNADIQIFKRTKSKRELVANYSLQGSSLRNFMCYQK